jgi:predicted dehydrogenase
MFAKPILEKFTTYSELVGLYDNNSLRIKGANQILGTKLPGYTNFKRMMAELNPDGLIIASKDSTHVDYIVKGLEAGKRVISEKPLCVDAKQARKILEVAQKTKASGAECWVTHNMRYIPDVTECKKLIKQGAIGTLKSMIFIETLDRRHGADYFRRWHRQKKNSGGLLVHKASHHFDALNFLADSTPETLVAQGGLSFYGKNGPCRGVRCMGCQHAGQCEYYLDMWKKDSNRKLYLDAESKDGYHRDGCVFDECIDIEDEMNVLYTYRNGVHVTYSMIAFASYEGWQMQFEGTEGRLDARCMKSTNWVGGDITVHGMEKSLGTTLTLFRPKEGMKEVPLPKLEGAHGGADPQIQHDLFNRPWDEKPTERMAPLEEAVQAILVGHAANVSIARGGKPIAVQDLLIKG